MYEQILAKRNKERIISLQNLTQTQDQWFAQNIKLLTFAEVNLTALQKILYQVVRGLLKNSNNVIYRLSIQCNLNRYRRMY